VLEQVLAQMQGAEHGVARLEAARARLAPEVVEKIIVSLNAHQRRWKISKLCTAWLLRLRKRSMRHRRKGRFSLEMLGAGAILANPLDSKVKVPYNIILVATR